MNQGRIMCNVTDMCTVTERAASDSRKDQKISQAVTDKKEMVKIVGNEMPEERRAGYFTNLFKKEEPSSNQIQVATPNFVNTQLGLNNVLVRRPSLNSVHMESLPLEFYYQDEEFQTTPDGKLFYKGKELMNCVVRITQTTVISTHIEYKCEIYIGGSMLERTISSARFTNINWLQEKIPGFATKGEKNNVAHAVYKYLNNIISQSGQKNMLEREKKPGWVMLNEELVYLTPDGTIPGCKKAIISEYGQRFGGIDRSQAGSIRLLLKMAQLTKNDWMAPVICLYTVMSFSYSIFKMAGILPKFVLFVHGPRGSYKTSVSLVLTQIERTESPKFNLKSKAAGIETGYKEYKDAVMLIDDLAPTEELRERNIMQSNLELVVRAFGDGTGVKRNYDFQDENFNREQYEAEGGAVITGEYTTGCESSLARCLFVPLKREGVNVTLLTELQEQKTALPMFLAGYINYLSQRYKEIIPFLGTRGKELRGKFNELFANPRYGEYYAQLSVVVELLFQKYAVETNQMNQGEADQLTGYFNACIEQAIQYNDRALVEKSPIVVLCQAIITKIEEGKFPVVSRNTQIDDVKHYILEDNEKWYIRSTDILAMKNEYETENGIKRVEVPASRLARDLCEKEIAIPCDEGKTHRYAKKIGKQRYVVIDKSRLRETANL